ncbi:DUF1983 domain-containing protein [Burkholderia cenocepacia]|nr:DUF1983 domain-containing protein [Burkholderia cenocepacia]
MEMLPRGSKSEGGSTSPTQAPDTLSSVSYAQMLDLLTEGPIYGPPSGDIAQSIYLNDVPLKNADGSFNFVVSSYDYRPGTVDQTYVPGFDGAQQIVNVGVSLTHAVPWNLTISDLTQNAVIVTLGISSLSSTDPSTGNVSGYVVAYQIQMQVDSGAWQTVVNTSFNGKCTSSYQRSHRITLSGATSAYNLRVIRVTQDNTTVYIQDKTSVVSYALVVDAKLRYPYSAVAALSVDAVQFSSVPTRSYDLKGLLVSVPSNYNPVNRVYTGAWDGTFVQAWTDNPAWIFYDLVLNNRYGAGQWVNASQVDRYGLYQIAQYCDQLVSDGMGGQEPRFTCNCYIQSRVDAYKVLQDLASIFRGMSYWAAGNVVVSADMPQQPTYLYTAANTINGEFKYVGSSLKTRYTAAVVMWNNPQNGYKQEPEYVEDADGIARYGVNRAQVTAFGCTSRGQAQRVGQWLILTSRYETDTVTFSVGLDGTIPRPGQIIQIADPNRASARRGGRIAAASVTTSVTLDKIDPTMAVNDSLTVIMPGGVPFKTSITGISGNVVTVNPALSAVPVVGAVWICESATVKAQTFRVMSIAEKDGITFEITATQYNASKFGAVDSGAAIDVLPITSSTFTTQAPPTGVTVSQWTVVDQGITKTNLTVSWQPAANAVRYRVQIQKDNGAWVDIGTTGQTSVDMTGIYAGGYIARVSCTNGAGISSVYAYSTLTPLNGKTTPPPVVSTLTATTDQVFSVTVKWTFPVGAGDTKYTELWYSHTNDFNTASQLGTYSYPTNEAKLLGLVAGYDLYFWARLVDTTGNTGAWYPGPPPSGTYTGVHGMSTMDASSILQYLTGQITATQLAQSLAQPIALLTPPEAGDMNSYAGGTLVYAGVSSEQSSREAADMAIATKLDTVQAAIYNNNSNLFAAVQMETTARISADAATASQLTTIQAQADSNTAAIQVNANSYAALNGTVSAMYTVKTQVTANGKTYVAGIGLSSDNTNGSQVLVTADRFAVLETAGGNTFAPFVIQNGQAFINQAFIGNAWITNAMIANAAITGAQIQNAAIQNANIANGAIASAQIQNGAIANAHIQNAAISSANIQNAAIQNAHIADAQIDTLKLGANAATSAYAVTNSGTVGGSYTCSGGMCAVFLVSRSNGSSTNIIINFAGQTIGVTGSGASFQMVAPGPGVVNWTCTANNGTSSFSVMVLEFKR